MTSPIKIQWIRLLTFWEIFLNIKMSTLDTKPIFKQFYTEFPNPTDDEIDILSQMIQQEHPSEKIQKWFPNAPNLDNE